MDIIFKSKLLPIRLINIIAQFAFEDYALDLMLTGRHDDYCAESLTNYVIKNNLVYLKDIANILVFQINYSCRFYIYETLDVSEKKCKYDLTIRLNDKYTYFIYYNIETMKHDIKAKVAKFISPRRRIKINNELYYNYLM